jgi:hypothetical protein
MTEAEFERELAAATGETLGLIRRRGFQLVEPPESEPLMVDWDVVYPVEAARRIQPSARRIKVAA